jgi:phage terminase small subunit
MLNEQQQRFVVEYVKDLHITKAAIRAGYSKKTAHAIGSRLLKHVEISAAIAVAQSKVLDRAELSAQRTLEEMRRLAFSNVQDLFDANGDLIPIHKLTREQAACISSLEIIMKNATAGDGKIDRVLKLKVWDKPKVMEMLGKHFALLTDRMIVEGGDELIQALYAGRERAAKRKR